MANERDEAKLRIKIIITVTLVLASYFKCNQNFFARTYIVFEQPQIQGAREL